MSLNPEATGVSSNEVGQCFLFLNALTSDRSISQEKRDLITSRIVLISHPTPSSLSTEQQNERLSIIGVYRMVGQAGASMTQHDVANLVCQSINLFKKEETTTMTTTEKVPPVV